MYSKMPDSKEDIVRFHLYEIKKESSSSMVQKKGKFSGDGRIGFLSTREVPGTLT